MLSLEREPSKRILLTLSPVIPCCMIAFFVIPIWIILHLNRDKMVNAGYMDVFFSVVLLSGIIAGYMDYVRFHITGERK